MNTDANAIRVLSKQDWQDILLQIGDLPEKERRAHIGNMSADHLTQMLQANAIPVRGRNRRTLEAVADHYARRVAMNVRHRKSDSINLDDCRWCGMPLGFNEAFCEYCAAHAEAVRDSERICDHGMVLLTLEDCSGCQAAEGRRYWAEVSPLIEGAA